VVRVVVEHQKLQTLQEMEIHLLLVQLKVLVVVQVLIVPQIYEQVAVVELLWQEELEPQDQLVEQVVQEQQQVLRVLQQLMLAVEVAVVQDRMDNKQEILVLVALVDKVVVYLRELQMLQQQEQLTEVVVAVEEKEALQVEL
tara:strand:+ start:29 stop:454 length:426 start_codon:yes stop_codon:yes gene_type:complete